MWGDRANYGLLATKPSVVVTYLLPPLFFKPQNFCLELCQKAIVKNRNKTTVKIAVTTPLVRLIYLESWMGTVKVIWPGWIIITHY